MAPLPFQRLGDGEGAKHGAEAGRSPEGRWPHSRQSPGEGDGGEGGGGAMKGGGGCGRGPARRCDPGTNGLGLVPSLIRNRWPRLWGSWGKWPLMGEDQNGDAHPPLLLDHKKKPASMVGNSGGGEIILSGVLK